MKRLVIVESPGKLKTIQSFLDKTFIVKASVGHIFQIDPKSDAIDIENNYEPRYVMIPKKKAIVAELKKLASECDEVYIATDNDREGSGIASNIAEFIIKKKCAVIKRAKFQEITKKAVLQGIENFTSMESELPMVNAQKARAVLDMLVGFKVSPILWKKVCAGTSAGRVQSIGLMLISQRQKEIDAFVVSEYWDISGQFSINNVEFKANYLTKEKLLTKEQTDNLIKVINTNKIWTVKSTTKSRKKKSPFPIFNTSSLQQFCSSEFNWDGKKTMRIAQSLYEGFAIGSHDRTGLITYHRTDAVNISTEAIDSVRSHIKNKFGNKYLPKDAIVYKSKDKNAQEAHEGIRPSHLEFELNEIKNNLPDDEYKMYLAIYNRFVACQMSDAEFDNTKVEIVSNNHVFTVNGQILVFDGFLKCWSYSSFKDEELPNLNEKDVVKLLSVNGAQHFTKPPAMFNTASLVKTLEEDGIGRPSTYATIIDTLLKRQYIEQKGKSFVPTDLGKKVNDYLLVAFPELMNANFTARIEDELDEIANSKNVWYKVVDAFYKELNKRLITAHSSESTKGKDVTDIICPNCGKYKLVKRISKFGSFYGCDGYTTKECMSIFTIGENGEPIAKEVKEKKYLEGVVCDKCGSKIIIRKSNTTGNEFGGCSKFPSCKRMFSLEGEPIENKFKKFKTRTMPK